MVFGASIERENRAPSISNSKWPQHLPHHNGTHRHKMSTVSFSGGLMGLLELLQMRLCRTLMAKFEHYSSYGSTCSSLNSWCLHLLPLKGNFSLQHSLLTYCSQILLELHESYGKGDKVKATSKAKQQRPSKEKWSPGKEKTFKAKLRKAKQSPTCVVCTRGYKALF